MYERLEEKEQVELFNRCTSRLSIFEDVVVLSHDDANEKINKLENQVAKLIQTLEILSVTFMAKLGQNIIFSYVK